MTKLQHAMTEMERAGRSLLDALEQWKAENATQPQPASDVLATVEILGTRIPVFASLKDFLAAPQPTPAPSQPAEPYRWYRGKTYVVRFPDPTVWYDDGRTAPCSSPEDTIRRDAVLTCEQCAVTTITRWEHKYTRKPSPGRPLLARLAAVEAERDAMKGLLRECEWAIHGHCPFCGRFADDGHAPDCKLAAALAEKPTQEAQR